MLGKMQRRVDDCGLNLFVTEVSIFYKGIRIQVRYSDVCECDFDILITESIEIKQNKRH